MTCFDDLTIDVLPKIFDYLTFIELYQTFFGLQKRLDNIIRDNSTCIILSGIDLQSFQIKYSQLNLDKLRSITLRKMNLLTLHSFIEKLPMKQFESITIGRFSWHYYPKDLYEQVWSIFMNSICPDRLRYLNLPYHIRYWNIQKLSFDFLNLEYAKLEYISVNQMLLFMNHTPNLRRFQACLDAPHKNLFCYTIILLQLKYLTLNLHDEWSFEQVQQLLNICPHLKHLILKLEAQKDKKIMFEPSTWQKLIEEKLSHLKSLRLQLNCIVTDSNENIHNYQKSFNHAVYWQQRQPQFQVTIYRIQRTNSIS
ncbi:unnamed protein product [Adineta steineri]|uniref:F-box domain-containing protein n=1 Tax=Adineta steineri TaxID=433720 RepID=A0A818M2K7_9BILA|nr:unnamed protein product [Adineta steineri]